MSRILSLLRLFGFNPGQTIRSLRGIIPFMRDLRNFRAQFSENMKEFPQFRLYPCLEDRYLAAGVAEGGYFHQDIAVARRIFEQNPRRHVDIGSRIDGFVAHVAVFREIDIFDIRELTTSARNISFQQCDLMAPLKDDLVACCDSLSCLHALEHFGLGRYGDPVDVNGHKTALANLIRMLEDGGTLYLSVPIGPQRVEFNGHRVFSPNHILDIVSDEMTLTRFCYIGDDGEFREVNSYNKGKGRHAYGCNFGIGIFEFRKNM